MEKERQGEGRQRKEQGKVKGASEERKEEMERRKPHQYKKLTLMEISLA